MKDSPRASHFGLYQRVNQKSCVPKVCEQYLTDGYFLVVIAAARCKRPEVKPSYVLVLTFASVDCVISVCYMSGQVLVNL